MCSPPTGSMATTPRSRSWRRGRRTPAIWAYVRGDRPFGGRGPPAALFTPHAIGAANSYAIMGWSTDTLRRQHDLRHSINMLWEKLPDDLRSGPETALLDE